MQITRTQTQPADWPSPSAVIALLKPITWFPPMWAYACGAISSGETFANAAAAAIAGVVLAGPLLCGASQAINDWFDRHVDAINEPHRVIPSGRMPGRWGLGIAIAMSLLSALAAALLGPHVLLPALIGLAFAWAYSAPPLRFKQNGWIGNAVVGLSYETLPWITAATAMTGRAPTGSILLVALLYGVGAHGILTLNDFKSIRGDCEMNIATLPARHGPRAAAIIASVTMAAPQLAVTMLLLHWGLASHALAAAILLVIQAALMIRFVADPVRRAVWYSSIGVGLYVGGMMIAAFGMRHLDIPLPIG
ncbi:chlorophyll synthase ChlG [Rhizobium sp. G21]|uniref:chlorophyll synthase ChlG n=1 Tax=Rhizobium sp. G21 TaxID=2758439 RepID=UPI0016018297|nr:chlorophyll synthase ChlG [Rhizobium sp. G21]MBB1251208.1 chlorophyll synthase ChlG [Rhizobium sp. G21]